MSKNILMAVATCALTFSLWAADADPMVGTWKLNQSESKYNPGPGPKSSTIQVEEDGDALRVRIANINNEGKPVNVSYSVKKDGKEYPMTGSPAADTTIWTRVDERTTDMVAKKGGKEVGRTRVVVSPDGRTQTVTGSGTNSEGQKYSSVAIFEKQ